MYCLARVHSVTVNSMKQYDWLKTYSSGVTAKSLCFDLFVFLLIYPTLSAFDIFCPLQQ